MPTVLFILSVNLYLSDQCVTVLVCFGGVYLQLNMESMTAVVYTSLPLSQAATECPLTSSLSSYHLYTVRGVQNLKNATWMSPG
jgi:hypothetical protein